MSKHEEEGEKKEKKRRGNLQEVVESVAFASVSALQEGVLCRHDRGDDIVDF